MHVSLDAAALWARSGAMVLVAPVANAVAAERVASDLCALAAHDGIAMRLDGSARIGERPACVGGTRRGRMSVGGTAHLLRARDGWIAVNLPRPDDRTAVPAWLAVSPRRGPVLSAASFSRRRALRPLGIDADAIVAARAVRGAFA